MEARLLLALIAGLLLIHSCVATSSGIQRPSLIQKNRPTLQPKSFRVPIGISSLGSFLFGYDSGVVAGSLLFQKLEYEDQPLLASLMTSSCLLGATLGAPSCSSLSDAYGRRGMLRLCAALFLLSGAMIAWSPTFATLLIGRFLGGLAIGGASIVVPVYIAEMAPPNSRGAWSILPQIMVSLGIICSYLAALAMSMWKGLDPALKWRALFAVSCIPALVLLVGCQWCPEPTTWLASSCVSTNQGSSNQPLLGRLRVLASQLSRHRKALFTAIGLQACQQLSGVNAINYYAPIILQSSGLTEFCSPLMKGWPAHAQSLLLTILIYAPKLPTIFATVSMFDHFGRRRMLLCGIGLMACALGTLSYTSTQPLTVIGAVMSVLAISIFNCAFVVSLGPLPNMLTAEFMPNECRGLLSGIASMAQWLTNALVCFTFPIASQHLPSWVAYSFFMVFCMIAFVFAWVCVPETNNLALGRAFAK